MESETQTVGLEGSQHPTVLA